MSHSGIHMSLSADSPEAIRELFEKCMAETNKLHYDGKLILNPGAAQVYVFGDDCPECKAKHWINPGCETCGGLKEVGPSWVANEATK